MLIPFVMGGPLPSRPVDPLCCLLGVFAGLGVGLLLVHDPGMGEVEQFGRGQQVVLAEGVGFSPALIDLVAAGEIDRVPGALLAVIAPDGDLQDAIADFVLSNLNIPSF